MKQFSTITTVLVCVTCRDDTATSATLAGHELAEATAAAAGTANNVRVQGVRCLANCRRGLSAALRRDNGWTYVFGGLNANADGPTLIEGARLLSASPDGLLPWRGRPDSLKRGLIARVPPVQDDE